MAEWAEVLDTALFVHTMNTPDEEESILDFNVDVQELPQEWVEEIYADPDKELGTLKTALTNKYNDKERINIVLKNFSAPLVKHKTKIHRIRANKINKVLYFDALVRISTSVEPRIEYAFFKHKDDDCLCEMLIKQDKEEEERPDECELCKKSLGERDLERDEDFDIMENYQVVTMEEEPEGLKGRQPERIECQLHGPFTKESMRVGVGERVSVLGILRIRRKQKKVVCEKYIEVIGIETKGKNYEDFVISDEDEARFIEMSQNPDLLMDFASAVAPNIFGHTMEKVAMTLQQFGGNFFSPEHRRGDTHILLIGDPGVGKSKMIASIVDIGPHVIKASGAPTTSVGLTAAAVQNPQGGFILEAGAAVLADRGLLVIDEFDKMKEDVRGALHQILEDQVCDVTKAGIVATLQARCSVLAVMNPKHNRFDPNESVASQINLVPSLLSRFDLVFALRDKVDEAKDREICKAIFRGRDGVVDTGKYKKDDLTRYIIYARSKVREMTTSEEAQSIMTEMFIKIRKGSKGSSSDADVIPITHRQLEGAARLAEAHAKMRLSNRVEAQDAEVAVRIIEYYLQTMCMDENGVISTDQAMGGQSASEKTRAKDILIVMQGLAEEGGYNNSYSLDEVCAVVPGLERSVVAKTLNKLCDDSRLFMKGDKTYKVHNL